MVGKIMRRVARGFMAVTLLAFATIACAQVQKKDFNIPIQPATTGIPEFGRQAGIQILVSETLVRGKQITAVTGSHSIEEALAILLEGTGLVATSKDGATYTVALAPSRGSSRNSTKGPTAPEVAQPNSQSVNSVDVLSTQPENPPTKEDLEQVTVTGTHIRGATDSPSPAKVYTRDDIDATGAITVGQFLQTLPQNFNGGASENTIGGVTGSGQTYNSSNGSAPNLRGLGSDATLVLINGHRVAPGSDDASFVDVSMIPLTAIERVEVVTDGASAIYGSDAVGGVVNFILRTKLDGAETRLQAGSVTSGARHNIQAGQSFGTDWGSGSAVLSYQYFDETRLSAASRPYLGNVNLPFDVLPSQDSQSVFASFGQRLSPDWELHGDLIYAHRTTNLTTTFGDPVDGYDTQGSPSQVDGYSASFSSIFKFSLNTELTVSTTYSESDTSDKTYTTPGPSLVTEASKTKSEVISVDGNLDGTLVTLPAGALRYAIGAQYRKETFGNTLLLPPTDNTFYPSRHIEAGYAELRVPLIAARSGGSGAPILQATLADRAERYSDFGSTNNPQAGLVWNATQSLSVRGTYGTSFKAPRLSELNPVPTETVIFPASSFSPGPQAAVNTLFVYGGNSDLKPEKARTWNVGLDFKPASAPGFSATLAYYNIVFKDEITVAANSVNPFNIFADEAFLGNEVLQRNPSAALVQQYVSGPGYINFFNLSPATVRAIFDSRSLNLSTVNTSGLDLGLKFKRDLGKILLETAVDGTYILAFDNRFTDASPELPVRNTEFNPAAVRLRGTASVTYRRISAGLYLNFVNAYTNNGVTPYEHVPAWITEDARVSYQFDKDETLLGGLSMALSVINLTDRAPPYVAIPGPFGINFDGANANALGRYVSILLQKRF